MFRPRFRFQLSTLLWMVALLGAVFAWLGYNAAVVRERQANKPLLNHFGFRTVGTLAPHTSRVPWIRKLLGDRPEGDLFYSPTDDPDGMQFQRVRELFPEAKIWGAPWDDSKLPEGIERFPKDGYYMI